MDVKVDGRRVRGDLTRKHVALAAADIATVSGLDSISMSQLAENTGFSKSGILTVFENREAIQLAAVKEARKVVVQEVIEPAWNKEPGVERLGAIIDNWFRYLDRRLFTGGCFLVATASEYAAQAGRVADAVAEAKREWVQLIEGELLTERADTAAAREAARVTAFKLDSYMTMANIRMRLLNDAADQALAIALCHELLRSLE
jgi:AcrR family transcriptional regulator